MLQYFETLTDDSGNSLLGATITVTAYPGGGAASIYNTNGTASPIPTSTQAADITGQVSFYITDGAYILTYTYKGTVYKTKSPVQITDPMSFVAANDAGTANTYAVTSSALPASLYAGLKVEFKALNSNTGASTFNLNATGAQNLLQPGGSALTQGQILAGGLYRVEYDGTEWQLIGSSSPPFYAQSSAEAAASVVPVNYSYPWGSFIRYGADPSGATDSTTAIQNALKANPIAFDGYPGLSLYLISATLRFTTAGQILRGNGFGDNNTAASQGVTFAPRTTLKWNGSAGGTMVSVYNPTATQHYSECQLNDLCLDGNSTANLGYEGYNNAVTTGAFRNQVKNCAILNCTSGALATGLMMGAGTVNANSNDFLIEACYVENCTYGLRGGGATMNARRTTFSHCAISAVSLTTGAVWYGTNNVYSTNGVSGAAAVGSDIDATTPQIVAEHGSYFENSTNGVYQPHTSHAAIFSGCRMSTINGSFMINWNSAAGNATVIGCYFYSTSSSFAITGENPQYEYNYLGTDCIPANGYRMRSVFSSGGISGIARFDQADFLYGITSTTAAVTGDGTVQALNAFPVTVDHDINSGVAASTGIFTAPVTAFYTFNLSVELAGLTSAITEANLALVVTGTSAQIYQVDRKNPWAVSYSNQAHMGGTVTVMMTKGDTCYMQIEASGGTKIVTVLSGGSGLNWRTAFHGRVA